MHDADAKRNIQYPPPPPRTNQSPPSRLPWMCECILNNQYFLGQNKSFCAKAVHFQIQHQYLCACVIIVCEVRVGWGGVGGIWHAFHNATIFIKQQTFANCVHMRLLVSTFNTQNEWKNLQRQCRLTCYYYFVCLRNLTTNHLWYIWSARLFRKRKLESQQKCCTIILRDLRSCCLSERRRRRRNKTGHREARNIFPGTFPP